jgi:hypothetical protein
MEEMEALARLRDVVAAQLGVNVTEVKMDLI